MPHTLQIYAQTREEVNSARDALASQFPNTVISYDLAAEPVDLSATQPELHELRFGIEFTLDIPGGTDAYEKATKILAGMCSTLEWRPGKGMGCRVGQKNARDGDYARFALYLFPIQHTLSLFAGTAKEVALVRDMLSVRYPDDIRNYGNEPVRIGRDLVIDHSIYKQTLTLIFRRAGQEACTEAHMTSMDMQRFLQDITKLPGKMFLLRESEEGTMDREHISAHDLFIKIPGFALH